MTNPILGSPYRIGLPFHANPQLWNEYISSEQPIVSAGNIVLTHGSGKRPQLIQGFLICKTAELNYSVGDEVEIFSPIGNSTLNRGLSITASDTILNIRMGSATNVFNILNKSTGSVTSATNANWVLVIKAYVFTAGDIITSLDTMGMVPLASGVVSSAAGVDVNLSAFFNKGYIGFKVIINDSYMSTTGQDLYMRVSDDGSVTFKTDNNYISCYDFINPISATYGRLVATSASNNSTYPNTIEYIVMSPDNASKYKNIKGTTSYFNSSSQMDNSIFSVMYKGNTNPITDIRYLAQSGNVSGRWLLYGLQEPA
jgi:hypothetical protein